MERFLANLDQVNPNAATLHVSARTGEGVQAWRGRLLSLG
jgi:Ni2+-binding GTPase involved in maturation of urease and hydrogenase